MKHRWEIREQNRTLFFICKRADTPQANWPAVFSVGAILVGHTLIPDLSSLLLHIDPRQITGTQEVFEELRGLAVPPPLTDVRDAIYNGASQFVLLADLTLTSQQAKIYGWVENPDDPSHAMERFRRIQIALNSPIGQAMAEQLRRPS